MTPDSDDGYIPEDWSLRAILATPPRGGGGRRGDLDVRLSSVRERTTIREQQQVATEQTGPEPRTGRRCFDNVPASPVREVQHVASKAAPP